MRKTLLLVVGFIIVLAGIVGYILGSAPEKLTIQDLDKQVETLDDSDNQNSTASDSNKTQSANLPPFDSLLITPHTTPLPLSLRAGIFFDNKTASESALQISSYGYPANVQQFQAKDKSLLNLVVLEPFNNEANLQLAKYELFKKYGVVTQRVITPMQKNSKVN